MRSYLLKISLFISAMILLSGTLSAQVNCVFTGKITNYDTGGGISGAKITLYKGGSVHQSANSSSNGKYSVKGPAKQNYKLVVSAPGYVSKTMELTFDNMVEEDLVGKDWKFDIDLSLIENHPDVDMSALENQTFVKGGFDDKSGTLEFDNKYIGKMSKLQDKMLAELDKAKADEKNAAAAQEQKYKDLVKAGDNAVSSNDYAGAIAKYEEAKKIKDDGSLNPKIDNAKKLQADAAANAKVDQEYQAKMNEAKKAFDQKDYAFAKTKYQEALGIKPNESEPQNKIKEIDKLIQDQIAQEQKYNEAIAKGDKAMLDENFDEAISQFNTALSVKPADPDATKRLADAQKAKKAKEDDAAAEQQKKADFDKLVQEGDNSFGSEDYTGAKTKYEDALKLFPNDQAVKDKLDKTNQKISENEAAAQAEKEKRDKYDGLITEADGLFSSDKLEDSKAKYQEALTLFDEAHPKDRIAEIDQKLKDQADAAAAEKEKKDKYDALIADADGLFSSDKLEDAKTKYEEALTLFDEAHPKDRIAEIEKKLKDQADAAAAEKEKKDKYEALIADADGLFSSDKLEDAKAKYEEALTLFDEAHPKDRIAEIEQKIKDNQAAEAEKEKRDKYDALIAEADGMFSSDKLEDAKAKYEEALTLFDEAHPNDRIAEIEQKLKDQADAAAAEKDKKDKYDALIAEADGLFSSDKLEDAKTKYEEALNLFDEAHPKDRIAEIDQKLKDQADAAAAEQEKQAEFDKLIQQGDNLLTENNWDEAAKKYNAAKAIFPDKDIVTTKLNELEDLKTEYENEEKFQSLVKEAEQLEANESWEDAKSKYEEAQKLKPGDANVSAKIDEINTKLADAMAANEKEEKFNALIQEADGLFDSESYEDAKSKYQEALAIKDDSHASGRMDEIDQKLSEQAGKEQAKKEYDKYIKVADEKFNAGEFEEAKGIYERAKNFAEDGNTYIDEQITKIDDELANQQQKEDEYNALITSADQAFDADDLDKAKADYEAALNMFDRDHPKNRLEEIKTKQANAADAQAAADAEKAKREQYDQLIEEGDTEFGADNLDEAENKFNEALGLYPDETYPKTKLEAIKKRREELANSAAADAEKEKREQYDALIAEADTEFSSDNLSVAKSKYEEALKLFPGETHPTQRIAEIESKLEDQNKRQRYDELIAKADAAFDDKKYDVAKQNYQQAQGILPGESYPQSQLDKIDGLLSEAAGKEQAEKEFKKLMKVAESEYANGNLEDAIGYYKRAKKYKPEDSKPDEMIGKIEAEIAQNQAKEGQYNEFISAADKAFKKNNWDDAKSKYYTAIGVFDRKYPRDQIALIERKIKEEADAKAAKEAEKNKKANYDKLIAQADGQFNAKDYDNAIQSYKDAYALIPEKYPSNQIDKINAILEELSSKVEGAKMYEKIIKQADEYFNAKNWPDARSYYARADQLRPTDKYPSSQIMKIDKLIEAEKNQAKNAKKDEQYNALIKQADGLFNQGESNYKAAVDKYNEAYSLKPSNYAKRQIDKINAYFKSQSDKQANAMYQKIIQQADKDFGDQKYDDAKGYYERAMKLKPSDPYPKRKLAEIKSLTEKPKEVNYGERISDDISLMDAEALITKAKDRVYNAKVDSAQLAKESRIFKGQEYTDEQYEKIMNTHNKWDEYMDEYYDNENEYDTARMNNVDRKERLEEFKLGFLDGRQEFNEEQTYANAEYAKQNDKFKKAMEEAKDGNRLANEDVVNDFEDNLNSWKIKQDKFQTEQVFSNQEYSNQTKELKWEMEGSKEGNRLNNEKIAEQLDDNKNKWLIDQDEFQTEQTFANHEYAKDTQEEKWKMEGSKEGNRLNNEKIAEQLDDNKNKWLIDQDEFQSAQIIANDDQAKHTEKQKVKMEGSKEGNRLNNEKIAEQLDDNKNKWLINQDEFQTEQTFANDKYAKETQEEKWKMEGSKEGNRLNNEKIAEQLEDKKIEGIEDRQNAQTDRTNAMEDFYKEGSYRKPEKYTPEFKNALARKYPEGVTTENFAKKDDNGEVIEVVIRKIVVKDNEGNDYVMIMNSYGRTYFKNGRGISEFTFKNETTGADLK